MVLVLTWWVGRKQPPIMAWASAALGVLGIVLLVYSPQAHFDTLGIIAALAGSASMATGIFFSARFQHGLSVLAYTGWQLLLASVPVIIGAWLLGDHQWFMPSASSLAAFTYITLVPMLFGNLLWFSLIQWLPPQLVSLSPIMIPMVAMVSGAIVLNEPLGWQQWLAMLLSASGLGLMLFRRSDRS